MAIRTSTLAKFIRLGGYETVKRVQRGRLKGRWKNLSKASRKTGISRPTIYKILKKHPEKPIINRPKHLEQLEKCESYKRFMQLYGSRLDKSNLKQNIRYMQIAIRMLEGKTPEFWTINDYKKIWYSKQFYSQECRGINKRIGVYFKRIMKADDRFDLLETFKYNAPPTGKKKQWFLHEREIKELVKCIKEKETLVLLFLGISIGARHRALSNLKLKDVDFHDKVIQVYESKTHDYVLKFPPHSVFELLETYVNDLGFSSEDKLFPKGYRTHFNALRVAGKRAKLKKKISTHILKHTFVTQASRHGVSAENIVHQTGTELRTLEKFYRAKDETNLRHELQGTKYTTIPFYLWIQKLSTIVKTRYMQLNKV